MKKLICLCFVALLFLCGCEKKDNFDYYDFPEHIRYAHTSTIITSNPL